MQNIEIYCNTNTVKISYAALENHDLGVVSSRWVHNTFRLLFGSIWSLDKDSPLIYSTVDHS